LTAAAAAAAETAAVAETAAGNFRSFPVTRLQFLSRLYFAVSLSSTKRAT